MAAAELAAGLRLRAMTEGDLEAAHGLSAAVGWPHRLEDWAFSLALGEGFVIEEEGRVLGTAMRWQMGAATTIGLVIIAPEQQGRGLGRKLMEAVLSGLSTPTVLLNATAAGRPLYEKLGFTADGTRIAQHQGVPFQVGLIAPAPGDRLRPLGASDKAALAALDAQASGLARETMIAALLDGVAEGVVLDREGEAVGCALIRRFGRGHVIGPVIAPDIEAAKVLIGYWLGSRDGQFIRVDIPEESELGPWLEGFGLMGVGPVACMTRGPALIPPGPAQRFGLVTQALG